MSNLYRLLPSVDQVLSSLEKDESFAGFPRAAIKDHVNAYLGELREAIRNGAVSKPEQLDWEGGIKPELARYVTEMLKPRFKRVLNATGVVLHTNLGRSLLADAAVRAVTDACLYYSNLEMDLSSGKRGSRYSHVEDLLVRLTGAEAGLVVNNNASAVLIVLETLARGMEVVVSRGELVEIGGSFRIPEVMAKSGAVLREVGATNRTHLRDFESAINEKTGLLMKAHTSNYRIIGFHKAVDASELAELAERHGLPVFEDLGSGSLTDLSPFGLKFEPTVQKTVSAGVSVVSFSGDKLLGGPQAGIIVGKKEFIDRIKKNPLNRAIRIDKMTLAALEATLSLYLDPDKAMREIPTLRMIVSTLPELKKRALRLKRKLSRILKEHFDIRLIPGFSRVGGGAYPEQDLPTTLIGLVPRGRQTNLEYFRNALLKTDPPLIGRMENDVFCLDVRTLRDDEFPICADVLRDAAEFIGGK